MVDDVTLSAAGHVDTLGHRAKKVARAGSGGTGDGSDIIHEVVASTLSHSASAQIHSL